jgi:class 3 adenylate cyclase
MYDGGHETHPLPADPVLAQAAAAVRDTGQWGWVVDPDWNVLYVTDGQRMTFGAGTMAVLPIEVHFLGPELVAAYRRNVYGANTVKLMENNLRCFGGLMLADASGNREALHAPIAPELRHVVDDLESDDRTVASFELRGAGLDGDVRLPSVVFRLRDHAGNLIGAVFVVKPASGMDTLGSLVSQSDPQHIDRMQQVARAGRRPAAILFADLEGSSPLSKRLSTASYFALGRRLVRAADRCVIDAGGIVGRHVGDGVVAFFLAETLGSESAAPRAYIDAARSLRGAVAEVAPRSGLDAEEVTLRFGLHWGSTLYVGNISTAGRNEVTALGDEVNEGARIEACAGGARARHRRLRRLTVGSLRSSPGVRHACPAHAP